MGEEEEEEEQQQQQTTPTPSSADTKGEDVYFNGTSSSPQPSRTTTNRREIIPEAQPEKGVSSAQKELPSNCDLPFPKDKQSPPDESPAPEPTSIGQALQSALLVASISNAWKVA